MPSDEATSHVFCASCGERNPRTNRFCGSCGRPIVLPPDDPTPAPVTAPPAAPVVPPPAPAPKPTPAPASARPVPAPAIPTDPLARERELERLLTLANVQRMRAAIIDARTTLQQALILAPHVSPSAAAPVHELLGDLFAAEERWDQAKEQYELALAVSEGDRPSAERKLGGVIVRQSDEVILQKMGSLGPRGDDLVEILRDPRTGRRHAGMAMVFSLIPGFGQFYCGKVLKAGIILAVFLIALLLFTLMPDRTQLMEYIAATLANSKKAVAPPGGLTWLLAGIVLFTWLYSVVDAPFTAAKTSDEGGVGPGINPAPMGSRADWEP